MLTALALLAVALFVGTPSALSAEQRYQCSPDTVCGWSIKNYEGTFSWSASSDTGCHTHDWNPNINSIWNRTARTVEIPGRHLYVGPYSAIETGEGITGRICIW
jgi:Peptidase inhibitor family I36